MPTGRVSSTTTRRRNLRGVEHFHRLADELIGPHGLRIARHDRLRPALEQVGAHVPAQVAVGDDADEPSVRVDDRRRSRSPCAVISTIASRHRRAERRERHRVAGVHDVAHEFEHRAEPSARMEVAEIDAP